MENRIDLKSELIYLGLFDKAKEIYFELGEKAALSYIQSSHRLLSKVYHPDLNPKNKEKANETQQRLNRVSDIVGMMKDEEIMELFMLEPSKKTGIKKKILVVEDEFGLQELFRDIFQMEGYDVRIAVDGKNGYDTYQTFKPDLVFTDVVMPEMSGIELVQKIREEEPDIKVIFISGFFGIKRLKDELIKDVKKYGYPMLAKPFKTSVMLELVKNYLG